MAEHVDHEARHEEEPDHQGVEREQAQDQGAEADLQEALDGVNREGREGARVAEAVVRAVDVLHEELGVEEAVDPIEERVLDHEHQGRAREEVAPAVSRDLGVDLGVALGLEPEDQDAEPAEVDQVQGPELELAQDLFAVGVARVELVVGEELAEPVVADHVPEPRERYVAHEGERHDQGDDAQGSGEIKGEVHAGLIAQPEPSAISCVLRWLRFGRASHSETLSKRSPRRR